MTLLLSVLALLIAIALVILAVRLLMWGLGALGVPIPAQIMQVIWVIVILIVLYVLVQWLISAGGLSLPGL